MCDPGPCDRPKNFDNALIEAFAAGLSRGIWEEHPGGGEAPPDFDQWRRQWAEGLLYA